MEENFTTCVLVFFPSPCPIFNVPRHPASRPNNSATRCEVVGIQGIGMLAAEHPLCCVGEKSTDSLAPIELNFPNTGLYIFEPLSILLVSRNNCGALA